MKKKISVLLALMLAATMLLSSCGSFNYEQDLSKYVTVGNVNGISVEVTIPAEVTEDDINDAIEDALESVIVSEYTEDENAAASEGDKLEIEFEGKIDGETFEGGSGEDTDLILGDGSYLEEFEAGIVGMKAGETKDVTFTFPEDYNEEVAGKEVTFTITVNKVSVHSMHYEYGEDIGDAALAEGDTANIKYTYVIDGKKSEEKTTGIILGESSLPDGFDAQLIGKKAGMTATFTLTVSDDYSDKSLAGAVVEYHVMIEEGSKTVVSDTLTDAVVAFATEFKTVDELKADVTETLNETYEKDLKTARYSYVWKAVLDGATVNEYPAKELKRVQKTVKDYYAGTAGNSYGLSLKEYVKEKTEYSSVAEFEEKVCKVEAQATIKENLVLNSLAQSLNITVTDEEIKVLTEELYESYKELVEFYNEYGYDMELMSYDEYAEASYDSAKETKLWENTVAKIMETATLTEKVADAK